MNEPLRWTFLLPHTETERYAREAGESLVGQETIVRVFDSEAALQGKILAVTWTPEGLEIEVGVVVPS